MLATSKGLDWYYYFRKRMNTIDIHTPQNVKLEMTLASSGLRLAAFAIDQVIFISTLIILSLVSTFVFGFDDDFLEVFIWLVIIPFIFFYSLIFESLWNGQTPGKRLVGIRAIRLDGEPLRMDEALSRWFMRIIDLYLSGGILAMLLVSSSRYNQRFGDMLGGTIVVKDKASGGVSLSHVMKLDTTDSYEPVYRSARLLQEEEALLVKNALIRYEKYPNEGHLKAIHELVSKLEEVLEVKKAKKSSTDFLRTLLKDYIVLTR